MKPPPVDLIAGGYPCQPFSVAGRQLGEADPRHLWPHMLHAIRFLRPRFALLENVTGHLALGFGRVLGDLAEIGYDAEWDCIPAVAVGAPHRRDRVFVVAYPQRQRQQPEPVSGSRRTTVFGDDGSAGAVADADGTGPSDGSAEPSGRPSAALRLEPERLGSEVADPGSERQQGRRLPEGEWRQPVPDVDGSGPRIFGRAPRPSDQWAAEPDVGRVADGVPARVDRLRGLGNAVVPAVAEHIGRLILEAA